MKQTAARFCAKVHASLDAMLGALQTHLYKPRLSDYLDQHAQQEQGCRKRARHCEIGPTTWRERHKAYESRHTPSTRDSGSATLERMRAGGLQLSERRWDMIRIRLNELGESLQDGTVNVNQDLESSGTVSCKDSLPEPQRCLDAPAL